MDYRANLADILSGCIQTLNLIQKEMASPRPLTKQDVYNMVEKLLETQQALTDILLALDQNTKEL